jgi:transketolase
MRNDSFCRKIEKLKKKVKYIRQQTLDMCVRAGTGHVSSSFSCAEILVSLYYGEILRYKREHPEWDARDRFVLSKGHASPILYAILADCGFFSQNELKKFCQADGIFGVHLQHDVPGVEITSGSLGHGFGIAAGMAKAAKMNAKSYRIFSLLGDGECYEGSIWETAMFASHHKLDNLLAIVDRNRLCVTGFTEQIVKLDPLDEKFRAFGWRTIIVDGHSFEQILSALDKFTSGQFNKPIVIIANTVKGKGISFMENRPLWHGLAPLGKDAKKARNELK